MAIERFFVNLPTKYQGISDLAPDQLRDFATELERRLTVNTDAQLSALTEQVVVEKSILPLLKSGSSTQNVSISVATTEDSSSAEIEAILWVG